MGRTVVLPAAGAAQLVDRLLVGGDTGGAEQVLVGGGVDAGLDLGEGLEAGQVVGALVHPAWGCGQARARALQRVPVLFERLRFPIGGVTSVERPHRGIQNPPSGACPCGTGPDADAGMARRGRSAVVGEWTDEELDELVEQAVVDAHGDDEQRSGFLVMIEEELALPFETEVLGVPVTVTRIEQADDGSIMAVCRRGRVTQRIGVLDLPLPTPPPAGARWVEAYRRWAA